MSLTEPEIPQNSGSEVDGFVNERSGRFVLLKHEVDADWLPCELVEEKQIGYACQAIPATQRRLRQNHWDLLLEWDDTLVTFELVALPVGVSRTPVSRLPNHRLMYLEFEGSISGDRGRVTQEAVGTYEYRCFLNRIEIKLTSDRLNARVAFPAEKGQWCAIGTTVLIEVAMWDSQVIGR